MDDNSGVLYNLGTEFIENLLQKNIGVLIELKKYKPRNSTVYITEQ